MLKRLKAPLHWTACLIAIAAALIYWSLIASDRYVSHSNVVLNSPQIAAPQLNFQSLLSGSSGNTADLLLLRDHLLSVDMLKKLQQQLDLRQHYADLQKDPLARLSDSQAPIEDFHHYMQRYIEVELDEYAGVLRIQVQAFSPEMAEAINRLLLQSGETHMNQMGQRLALEQVGFLEKQVQLLKKRFDTALQARLQFQNESGLISPEGTIESLSSVIATMEGQLANLQAKRTALLSFQSSRSPELRRTEAEIQALQEQIRDERNRLAEASGSALNVLTSEYQQLEMNLQFAKESYSAALSALQNTRIEAARQLKKVSVLQSPTTPEYATEPRRIYNITVFTLMALLVTLIVQMMLMIIRDHKD